MSDNKQGTGIDRRGVLECMIWAGTGVIWTLSGGVPKSSQLLGIETAQAAEKAATGFSFLKMISSEAGDNAVTRYKPDNKQGTGICRRACLFPVPCEFLAALFKSSSHSPLLVELRETAATLNAPPNALSLSRMRYLGAVSHGNASVIWRASHSAVGFWVTANHNSCRRRWPRTRNTNSCRKAIVGTTKRSIDAISSGLRRKIFQV
jgi:hypothetical protein